MTPKTAEDITALENANLAQVKRERIRECLAYLEAGHSPQALAEIFPHGCIIAARHFYDVERKPYGENNPPVGAMAEPDVPAVDTAYEALTRAYEDPHFVASRWLMSSFARECLNGEYAGYRPDPTHLYGVPIVLTEGVSTGKAYLVDTRDRVAQVALIKPQA